MKNKVKFTRKSIFCVLAAVLLSFSLFSAVSYSNTTAKAQNVYDIQLMSPSFQKFNAIGVDNYIHGLTVSYSTNLNGYSVILDYAFNNLREVFSPNFPNNIHLTVRVNLSNSNGRQGYFLISLPYSPDNNNDRTITLFMGTQSYNLLSMHNYNAEIISTSSYTFPSLSTLPNSVGAESFLYVDSIFLHDLLNQYPSVNVIPSLDYYKTVLFCLNILIPLYGQDTSYDAGYSNGYISGRGSGITEEDRLEIYQTGYDDGYAEGDQVGYNRGYDEGYQDSQDSLQSQLDSARQDGYDVGYDEGFEEAEAYVDEARQQGYDQGYGDGVSDTILETSNFSWYGLFTAVIDVPVRVFSSLFDFEVFGINLAGFFVSVLSIVVIIFILKKLL